MAQLYSTGGVFIYVGVGNIPPPAKPPVTSMWEPEPSILDFVKPPSALPGYNPRFLGTTVDGPEAFPKPIWRKLTSDQSGEEVDDIAFMGEEAIVTAEVNRYNESIYASISSRPSFRTGRGFIREFDIGQLMLRSGYCYPLWLRFPHSVKAALGNSAPNPGIPPTVAAGPNLLAGLAPVPVPDPIPMGYHFWHAYLIDDGLTRLGSRARIVSLRWHCVRQPFDKDNPGAIRVLYDHDMSNLPEPN